MSSCDEVDKNADKTPLKQIVFFQTPYKHNLSNNSKSLHVSGGVSKCLKSDCKCRDLLKNLVYSPSSNYLFQSPSSLEQYVDSICQERINVLKLVKQKETDERDENEKENNMNLCNVNIGVSNKTRKNLLNEFESSKMDLYNDQDLLVNSISFDSPFKKRRPSISYSSKKIFLCSETKTLPETIDKLDTNLLFTPTDSIFSSQKKKRQRKSHDQISLLNQTYNEHSSKEWNKELISEVANQIGLSESKVYKWLWDKKNKEMSEKKRFFVFSDKKNDPEDADY